MNRTKRENRVEDRPVRRHHGDERDDVVEQRVGDEAARIDVREALPVAVGELRQGLAALRADLGLRRRQPAVQLLIVVALEVVAVVLVEVLWGDGAARR